MAERAPGGAKLSTLIGLIGGILGLATTVVGIFAAVVAYFATREQLAVVDCHQYYGQDSLSYQTEQMQLLPVYLQEQAAAVAAKLASEKAPQDENLRVALEQAKQKQNDTLKEIQDAQKKSKEALEAQRKCGYKGPVQFH